MLQILINLMPEKEIPLFTIGGPGVPSVSVTPEPNANYYSAYSGEKLQGRPIAGTPHDGPTPGYWHGGIELPVKNIGGNNKYVY